MSDQIPVIYALLIGIDSYKPNRLYKNLKGAVRDINLVETFLTETLKVPVEQIRKLISPNQEDTALQLVSSDQDQEPTYENIVNAFKVLTEVVQPGEQVYIHYSGHGGRATTVYPFKQEPNDEGIVPMDIGDSAEGRYLRDVEMTTLLKRMTDKGIIVTMVLDSCHSGGSTRGDAEIRSAGQTDVAQRTSESLVADPKELEQNWLDVTRNSAVGAGGLPQARDYVLLAACRPNEYAYEYAVNGGSERHGALTYWMIDTLTSVATSGQPLTYKLLHDRINAQVQSKFAQQIPMIVGESDRLVFGSDRWSTPFTVAVIKVTSETEITINAGQAQGLSKGTRFSIYPLSTTDFTDRAKQVAIAELTQVDASESTARILTPEAGGIPVNGTLEPGAPAIMISAPVDLIQRVRFFAEKVAGDQENDLPSSLVEQQTEALDRVRQALASNGWVVEVQEGESATYQVALDREGNYEICQNGMPIPNLRPLLAFTEATAPKQVVDRLVHLAKYQAVQSLDNSSSKLAPLLTVELVKDDDSAFDDPQNPVIQAGDIICLRLTNKGTQPLKVAVLDIEPTWAVSQIPLGGLESPFFNLDAGATEEVKLAMSLPDDDAYHQAKETLKVFAVQKGLADFRWLTLPALDEPPATRGAALEESLGGEATRSLGEPEGINPLNNLMKMIGADLVNAPNVTRAATMVVDPKQDWVTKQVQILIER
ncbi:caspase family protein [Nodosilinea nodulosa]|uniref:caspase family protein n=1 Tax=Nodosilinea nodulosa TaxID=416001 RepID=UPI0003647D17|nr:caspase family protein [Nodosilinea nodulosa]